jgi:hypothetical protein
MANKHTDIVVVSDDLADGPIFILRLQGKRGSNSAAAIRALRAVIKTALRRHKLRCISVQEDEPPC